MGTRIATLRERQRQSSAHRVARFRAVADADLSSGGVLVSPEARMGSGAFFSSDTDAARQYAHYRGVVHSAIRPQAHTVAGLPIHVAREDSPRNRAGRRGRDLDRCVRKGSATVDEDAGCVRATTHDGRRLALPMWMKGVAENLELFETHPLLDVLQNPNPVMTDWHLKYLWVANIKLTGRAHWWLTSDSDGNRVLWPIPTHWIEPVHNKRPFTGWTLRPGGGAATISLKPEEIVYFVDPDPADLLGAVSATQAQGRAVSADEAMQAAQDIAFRDGMWARYGIIVGDVIDEDGENQGRPLLEHWQREQIYTQLKRLYAGVLHAGEPLIFDRLIKDVIRLDKTVQEMDFPQSGKITYGRITQGLGSHPYVMGETEPTSRAASAEARKHFADFTITPQVEMGSRVLTKTVGVMPEFAGRDKLAVWIEPYTPQDREERRKDWDLLAKHRAVLKRELRRGYSQLGIDPEEGEFDDATSGPTAALAAPKFSGFDDFASSIQERMSTGAQTRAGAAWLRNHDAGSRRFQRSVEAFLAAQCQEVQEALRTVLGDKGVNRQGADWLVDQVFRVDEQHAKFLEVARDELRRLAWLGAYQELHNQKQEIDVPPDMARAIEAELRTILGRPYWRDMQAVTRERLAKTIQEGLDEGESLYKLMVRIGDSPTVPGVPDGVLGSASNVVRAENIARTESTGALNCGHDAQQKELLKQGLIKAQRWLVTPDEYTRETHRALHRKTAPGDFEPGKFLVGGHEAPYPGHWSLPAKERCQCRCNVVSVV